MKKYAQKRTVRVQKMGKWGFVPKVWVALLATLISISLFVSCENTAGGGSSSAGGRDADAGAGGSGNRAMYTFYDADGNNVGFARIASEVKFSEIKKEADTNSAISNIQQGTDFKGWVDDEGNDVEDHHTFSKDTSFLAKSASSVLYAFKDKDGTVLGRTMLRGEQSFGEIKSKVADVSVVESVTGFLGWVVDGDTTLIKNENKYSSETTFVATYEKYRKIDVPDLYYTWAAGNGSYLIFTSTAVDAGDFSLLRASDDADAKQKSTRLAMLEMQKSDAFDAYYKRTGQKLGVEDDTDYKKAKTTLDKFKQENIISEGNWYVAPTKDILYLMDSNGFDSLHLDLLGRKIVDDNDNVLYTRIN